LCQRKFKEEAFDRGRYPHTVESLVQLALFAAQKAPAEIKTLAKSDNPGRPTIWPFSALLARELK